MDVEQDGRSRRPADAAAPAPILSKVDKLPAGLKRIETAKDGNCLFRAMGQAVTTVAKPKSHEAVRAAAVAIIAKSATHWDGKPVEGKDLSPYSQTNVIRLPA